jgi:hypothetical protein
MDMQQTDDQQIMDHNAYGVPEDGDNNGMMLNAQPPQLPMDE